MQRKFVDMQEDSSIESRTYFGLSLPIQVRRSVFANLLALVFVKQIEEGEENKYPDRSTSLGDFLLEGDPEGSDIDTYLLKSLFQRYRVVFEEEHPMALEKTDIAVFSRSDYPKVPGGLEKVWSAYLYRNE